MSWSALRKKDVVRSGSMRRAWVWARPESPCYKLESWADRGSSRRSTVRPRVRNVPMRAYSLTHLGDAVLTRELAAVVAHERTATAAVLAHLAEFDARRLYLPAGYPSMVAYCVHELRLSEDGAYNRIHAARAARQFPALFSAVAEGRLHLTGAGLLAPPLTAENADALLAAAAYGTKSEIELLLAQRFPRSELLALVQPLPHHGPPPAEQH